MADQRPERAQDYDRFVDWDKRLAREAPFFERLFAERRVHTLVDAGCGTGRHAILFASWGLEVVGVDPDAAMLEQARANSEAAGANVRFVEGRFGELAGLGLGEVDALTCTGNALPHVAGLEGLRDAFRDFAKVLRPGGTVVLHLLNHERLMQARIRSMPPVVRQDETGTWVFLRLMDYLDGGIGFEFLTLHRPGSWETGDEWEISSRRSLHTAMPAALLDDELRSAAFGDVRLYGDHSGKTFAPEADESVIVVARRQG